MKSTEELCLMTLKMMQSLRKSWPVVPKMDLVIFNASSGKSENLHFDVLILSKVYYVWTKKKYRVLCHNHEEWCKIWRGTDLCLKIDIRTLANFDQTLKSLKIWTLMGFFWSKSIVFEVKKYIGDHYIGLSYWRSMQALKEK